MASWTCIFWSLRKCLMPGNFNHLVEGLLVLIKLKYWYKVHYNVYSRLILNHCGQKLFNRMANTMLRRQNTGAYASISSKNTYLATHQPDQDSDQPVYKECSKSNSSNARNLTSECRQSRGMGSWCRLCWCAPRHRPCLLCIYSGSLWSWLRSVWRHSFHLQPPLFCRKLQGHSLNDIQWNLYIKGHPRDLFNVVLIHRWSLYAGSITLKVCL